MQTQISEKRTYNEQILKDEFLLKETQSKISQLEQDLSLLKSQAAQTKATLEQMKSWAEKFQEETITKLFNYKFMVVNLL